MPELMFVGQPIHNESAVILKNRTEERSGPTTYQGYQKIDSRSHCYQERQD